MSTNSIRPNGFFHRGTRRVPISSLAVLLAVALVATAGTVHASTPITWAVPASGGWWDANNWNPQTIPHYAGQDAIVPDGLGMIIVSMEVPAGQMPVLDHIYFNDEQGTLDLLNAYVIVLQRGGLSNHGTLHATQARVDGDIRNFGGASIVLDPGQQLVVGQSHLTNNGTITINGDNLHDNTYLSIAFTDTLDGSGKLRLHATSSPDQAQIAAAGQPNLVQMTPHTIGGTGRIATVVTNNSLISADVPNNALTLTDMVKYNNGTISAINGATLDISSPVSQGPSGTILADGGTVLLHGAISGGIIHSVGSSDIRITGGTLAGITNTGTCGLVSGASATLPPSTITNQGTFVVNLDHGTTAALLFVNGGVTFTGSGELRLSAPDTENQAQINADGNSSLTNSPSHAIRGTGRITLPVVNNGLVQADQLGKELALTDQTKTNYATMSATSGGILDVSCPINQGPSGTLLADGGTVNLHGAINGGILQSNGSSSVQISGGTLSGITIAGNAGVMSGASAMFTPSTNTNLGTFSVNLDRGAATASLNLNGAVTFTGSGALQLQAPDSVDQAQINPIGNAYLDNEAPHVVRGTGRIVVSVINNSVVQADRPGEKLALTDYYKTNYATMSATNGGILDIACPINQGASGTLLADGGTVDVHGNVSGGRFNSTNGGSLLVTGDTWLTGVTNLGTLKIPGGSIPYFETSTFTNSGVILVNSDHVESMAGLYMHTHVYITGTGEIRLQAGASLDDAVIAEYGWGFLHNEAPHAVRGTGHLMAHTVNDGVIEADVSGKTLWATGGGINNSGTLRASGGGILNAECWVGNYGTAEAVSGGQARFTSPGNYSGGTLTGGTWRVADASVMRLVGMPVHTVAAAIILDGPLACIYSDDGTTDALAQWSSVTESGSVTLRNGKGLGPAAGLTDAGLLDLGTGCAVHVGTDYTQASGGSLYENMGGSDAAHCGRLNVTGTATLSGGLTVSFDGYMPHLGETFVAVDAGARSGQFDSVLCATEGVTLSAIYTPTQALVQVSGLPAAVEPVTTLPREIRLSCGAFGSGPVALQLDLPVPARVALSVFDVSGRRVAVLADGAELGGTHRYTWNGRGPDGGTVASGVYLALAEVREASRTVVRWVKVVRVK